jgi:hypothetical protein
MGSRRKKILCNLTCVCAPPSKKRAEDNPLPHRCTGAPAIPERLPSGLWHHCPHTPPHAVLLAAPQRALSAYSRSESHPRGDSRRHTAWRKRRRRRRSRRCTQPSAQATRRLWWSWRTLLPRLMAPSLFPRASVRAISSAAPRGRGGLPAGRASHRGAAACSRRPVPAVCSRVVLQPAPQHVLRRCADPLSFTLAPPHFGRLPNPPPTRADKLPMLRDGKTGDWCVRTGCGR